MPTGIYKRKPLSYKKRKLPTSEHKKRISDTLKGHPVSKEARIKMSKSHKGMVISKETRQKLSKASEGRKFSKETRQKMSESAKGRKHTEEARKKISESHKGKNHYNWKGGVSLKPYSCDWIDTLRDAIRKRDNFICQECGIHQDELNGWCKKLDVHHIDYNKENCNPNNLVALCRSCHTKTNYKREYWIEYFKN